MKKITIKTAYCPEGFVEKLEEQKAELFVAEAIQYNSWGKPERWVLHKDEPGAEAYDDADVLAEEIREISPSVGADLELISPEIEAKDAVLDENGEVIEPAVEAQDAVYLEISPAVPAVEQKWVKLKAEYTVSIEDITQEHNLQQVIMKRKAEYPSAEEFMNAFFDGGDQALAALQEKRLLIKQKYPKS